MRHWLPPANNNTSCQNVMERLWRTTGQGDLTPSASRPIEPSEEATVLKVLNEEEVGVRERPRRT